MAPTLNNVITLFASEVALYYESRVPDLRQRGKRWRGPCPIHRGKYDNFSVHPETGLWRCWSGCGRGGDIVALEMAMTGLAWRDAVTQIEQIVGRLLVERAASRAEQRAVADRRARQQGDLREAEAWRIAATAMAEEALENLLEAVPERYAPTQLLLQLRGLQGAALIALFRDWMSREPHLTAGLVYAGERARQRQCDQLARFIVAGAEVNNAA